MRCPSTQLQEGEPLLEAIVDDSQDAALSSRNSEIIDRHSNSGKSSTSRSTDAVDQHGGGAAERLGDGETEKSRISLLDDCTAARATTAYEEGGVTPHNQEAAAATPHHVPSDRVPPSLGGAPAASSSPPGGPSTPARPNHGSAETQNSRRCSGRATDKAGGEHQPSVSPCRAYALIEKREAAAREGGNSLLKHGNAIKTSEEDSRNSNSKTIITEGGATGSTCCSCSSHQFREAVGPSTAGAEQQQLQISPRCVTLQSAAGVDTLLGPSRTPHLLTASGLQQQSTTARMQQQNATSTTLQQQEASGTLCCIPPQMVASNMRLQEMVDDSLCCTPEPTAAQTASYMPPREEKDRSCCRTEEGIEHQEDATAYREGEDGDGAEGHRRPLLLPERKVRARSCQGGACGTSSSRVIAAAAAGAKKSLKRTAGRGFAFRGRDGRQVWGDDTFPLSSSSASLPASISSPLIAEASQLAVSRVDPTSAPAAGGSGGTSRRSRWLSLPVCCCCWLSAWVARRGRASVGAPSTGAGTNAATVAGDGERPAPSFCSGSYNVYLLLVISAFMTLFSVTAQGQLFDNWLFFLGNESTIWVGKAESVSGMTSLLSAVPVGLAVDRVDRSKLCKLGAFFGVISSIVSSVGCWESSMRLVIASLVLSGMTWELFTSAGSAIFTDTLDEFSRVYWFTVQGVVMTLCAAVGPGLMAIYFLIYGDTWEMPVMQLAIISSTLFFGVGGSLLFCGVQNPPRRIRRFSGATSQDATFAALAAAAASAAGATGGAAASSRTAAAAAASEAAETRRGEDRRKEQLCVVETGIDPGAVEFTGKREEERNNLPPAADTQLQAAAPGDEQGTQEMPDAAHRDLEAGRESERRRERQQQGRTSAGSGASERNRCRSSGTAYSSCSTQVPCSLVSSETADGRSGDEEGAVDGSSIGRKQGRNWWSRPSSRCTCAVDTSSRGCLTSDGRATWCSSRGGSTGSSRGASGAAGHVLREGLLFGVHRKSSREVAKADDRVRDATLHTQAVAAASFAGAATTDNKRRPSYYSALPSDCPAPCAEPGTEERAAAFEATAGGEEAKVSAADCTCQALHPPAAKTGLLCPVHSTGEATSAATVACVPGGAARHVRTTRSSMLSLVQENCSAGHASSFAAAASSSSRADEEVHAQQATPAAPERAATSPHPCCCAGATVAAPRKIEPKPCPSEQVTTQCPLRGSFAAAAAAPLLEESEQRAANLPVSAAQTGWAETQATLNVPACSAAAATHDQLRQDPAAVSRTAASSSSSSAASRDTLPTEEWMNELTSAQRKIPYLVAASDAVRALGAGMTVKFFPIFFEEAYNFTPLQICFLASSLYISVGLFMLVGRSLAARFGRAGAVSTLTFAGWCMLMSMCVAQRVEVMVVVYILRGALQNAASPLTRSIVMDFTSTRNRGKWNAVQSFNSTLWSGSAFVGGIVADINMRFAFFVTGAVYMVAWIVFAPVTCLLPEAEKKFR